MTLKYKTYDMVLKFLNIINDHRKHIIYVVLISMVQIVLVLWFLNIRRPSEALNKIEEDVSFIIGRQETVISSIDLIHKQLVNMVKKDSVMEDQLQHYPASLPIAMADLTRASSVYSERIDPITHVKRFHWGIDYPARKGTPVYATASGIVEKADDNDGNYGKVIKINHLNGYQSLYAHLDQIDVDMNEDIKRGDLIGTVGNTGRATGNHLHYEITYMEKRINPNIFRTPLKQAPDEKISGLLNYRSFLATLP